MNTAIQEETSVDLPVELLPAPVTVRKIATHEDSDLVAESLPVDSGSEERPRLLERLRDSDAFSSLLAITDQAMISGTNFVTAVLVGRCCGEESLGLYSLVAAALAMTIGVQDQLITAPYILYRNRCRPRRLQGYSGSVLVHQSLIVSLITIALGMMWLMIPGSQALASTIATIFLVCSPVILFRAFVRNLALARCDFPTVFLLDAIVCLTQLTVVGSLAATGSLSLPAIYVALGITSALATVLWFRKHRSEFRIHRKAIRIDAVRNWRFGRWALATHLAGTSTPYIMPWVLFAIHGERATGLLASCSVIVGVANILLAGMEDFLTPRATSAYAQGGATELLAVLRKMRFFVLLAIGSVCAVAFGFGELVIQTLYDGKFVGAGELVGLLTLAVLANALGNLSGNGLWAIDRPKANFTADMATLVVAVIFASLLIGPYSAKGAVIATLLASVVGATFRHVIFRKELAARSSRLVA